LSKWDDVSEANLQEFVGIEKRSRADMGAVALRQKQHCGWITKAGPLKKSEPSGYWGKVTDPQLWNEWVERTGRSEDAISHLIRYAVDGASYANVQQNDRERNLGKYIRNAKPEQLAELVRDDPKVRENVEAALDTAYAQRAEQRNQERLDKNWGEAGYTPEEAADIRADRAEAFARIDAPSEAEDLVLRASMAMGTAQAYLSDIAKKHAAYVADAQMNVLQDHIHMLQAQLDVIERNRVDAQRFADRRVS